jgi:hypothetical protein
MYWPIPGVVDNFKTYCLHVSGFVGEIIGTLRLEIVIA